MGLFKKKAKEPSEIEHLKGQIASMAARLEALMLDPVYTGKTMAGLVALVREGTIPPGARVLFVHTGGLPALFGYEKSLSKHLEALHEI